MGNPTLQDDRVAPGPRSGNSQPRTAVVPSNIQSPAPNIPKPQEPAFRPRDPALPYFVQPEKGITASNNTSPFPIIVENGMNMSPECIAAMGQGIANRFGRPALVIPNNTDGFQRDLRNCIIGAFSAKAGARVEQSAASHLAAAYVARLNDQHPIESCGYSQGTLITQNVLSELRSHLIAKGEEEKTQWESFADRFKLRTYGAALHRWPSGIAVQEHRHLGDYVAVVGDVVSLYHGTNSLLRGEFSRRADVTTLPVFKDPHSIQVYLENSPRFYVQGAAGLTPQQQATNLVSSMQRGEFSDREYDKIVMQFCAPADDRSARARDANKAVMFSRKLVSALSQSPTALQVLDTTSVSALVLTSERDLRPEPRSNSIIDRRLRPGSTQK